MNSFLIGALSGVFYPLVLMPRGCDRCFLVPRTALVSSSTQTRFLLHHLLYTLGLAGLLLGGIFGRMIARLFSLLGIGRQARNVRLSQPGTCLLFLGLGGIASNYCFNFFLCNIIVHHCSRLHCKTEAEVYY